MKKETVEKFDLEAAFKALDEIEIPVAEKGIAANRVDLKERFNQKSAHETLVEDYYNVNDNESLNEAQEDREGEVAQAKLARIEKIVDLDAESPEDLLPSYVGKVIIQCPQCMTLFYKNPEDIEHSEENPEVVNINEVCQHCGNTSGYTLIGKVDSVSEEEAANYEAAEEPENELNLDFDLEEPAEEEQPAEEAPSEEELDLDLSLEEIPEETEEEKKEEAFSVSGSTPLNEDADKPENANVKADQEISDTDYSKIKKELQSAEEKKEESVHASELLKDAEKDSDLATENHSEKLTLNEGTNQCELTEEVDKDLDAKLKAHNDYIAYLQQMIKQEEEALKSADNDEIKAAIQRRLDAFMADLDAALPDAVKNPETPAEEVIETEETAEEVPSEEPVEETPEEEVAEETSVEESPVDEALTEDTEAQSAEETPAAEEVIALLDLSGSLASKEAEMVKAAKEAGATKMHKFTDTDFTKALNFAKANADKKFILLTNADIEVNKGGKELEALPNVATVKADEKTESLNESLKEAVEDDGLDILFASDEFKKPISEKEVQKYLGEGTDGAEELDEAGLFSKLKDKVKDLWDRHISPTARHDKKTGDNLNKDFSTYVVVKWASMADEGVSTGNYETTIFREWDKAKRVAMEWASVSTNGPATIFGYKDDATADEDIDGKAYLTVLKTPATGGTIKGQYLGRWKYDGATKGPKLVDAITGDDHDESPADRLAQDIAHREKSETNTERDATVTAGQVTKAANSFEIRVGTIKWPEAGDWDTDFQKAVDKAKNVASASSAKSVSIWGISKADASKGLLRLVTYTDGKLSKDSNARLVNFVKGKLDGLTESFSIATFEDFDEAAFSAPVTKFLTETYSNVKDFKVTDCSMNEELVTITGVISFNSGNEKETVFEFTPSYCADNLVFSGCDKDFSDTNAFSLYCDAANPTNLVTENFEYRYTVNNTLVEGLN